MSIDAGQSLRTDVLVIGAGQAGLAAAHALEAAGIAFLIVDASPAVGDSWRNRYDGLTLFTPRSISALPGMPLVGDPDGYATKDEFAEYLARYAAKNSYGVISATKIVKLLRVGRLFEAFTADGLMITSRAVIVATGSFPVPRIPALSRFVPVSVDQLHVADFQGAYSIADGAVLVVGDGASGRDVALSLSATHRVLLAGGRKRRLLPEWILGRNVWWWLDRFGLLRASANSFIGRRIREADPFPRRGNDDQSLARTGVIRRPRLTEIDGGMVVFEDASREVVRTIVWATGYVDDFRWIEIEGATGRNGDAIHSGGVSPVDGLYFVGRPWQRNRASGLIAGVGDDASFVVDHLRRHGEQGVAPPGATPCPRRGR
ncbi:NAD(P)-binding domain-containing protein [Rhizobium sp. Root149]|uniref:flavin-containing monooxygenase n=1 Tax=Rhizobium sp. Root149 TaxID=1736473 RepID=UPI0009EABA40|nr:NAD(P)-binding domain-containing protein [Rhizobium sp. Root149]